MRYPHIDEGTIITMKIVGEMVRTEGSSYLDDKACPYTKLVKDYFRDLASGVGVGVGDVEDLFAGSEDDEPEVLDRQIQKVLNKLNAMEGEVGSFEPNERLAFFKTRTMLLEKLILLREKVVNIKELRIFQAIVMEFLEDICTKDQIAELIGRLK